MATNWYNYTLASAGTIYDENTTSSDPVTNTTPATESICPKGWTLPSKTQSQTIGPSGGSSTYLLAFSPVLGGSYSIGKLTNEDVEGDWWNSVAYNGARRYYLYYKNSLLNTGSGIRINGRYIRCINKQKTVLDLTYMQEMNA